MLAVLRQRETWFARHVDMPLGHKTAPIGGSPGEHAGEPKPLLPAEPGEILESRITDLAALAVEAIRVRVQRGEEAVTAVRTVLAALFLTGSGAEEIDQLPGTGEGRDERLSAILADPAALTLLADQVMGIVCGTD